MSDYYLIEWVDPTSPTNDKYKTIHPGFADAIQAARTLYGVTSAWQVASTSTWQPTHTIINEVPVVSPIIRSITGEMPSEQSHLVKSAYVLTWWQADHAHKAMYFDVLVDAMMYAKKHLEYGQKWRPANGTNGIMTHWQPVNTWAISRGILTLAIYKVLILESGNA